MKELNGDYLNPNLEENPYWYNGENNKKTGEYDRTQSISYEYQQYIMYARWYLGGCAYNYYNFRNNSAFKMYNAERNGNDSAIQNYGSSCGYYCNDEVIRADYIDKLIGLAYPSDFGFAAMDNGTSNCLTDMSKEPDCSKKYNWMSKQGHCPEMTISKLPDYNSAVKVVTWSNGGYIFYTYANNNYAIRPTLYLKSNTLITAGSGLSSDPYIIG